jgi:NADPH:quinone reductase-like Zn-dependent oxidoreductase
MKAIVVHEYGGPEVLKWEDFPDPVPTAGEILVRLTATSVNPIDSKRRSGAVKAFAPIQFPGIVGVDLSGTVVGIGEGVSGFAIGDTVFGMGDSTYAELCVVKAASIAKIPAGLDPVDAAALPLVLTTAYQLVSAGAGVQAGQTVLVAGAAGSVGRAAVFAAKSNGAVVIAGVRKSQWAEAQALGADQVIAIDDDDAVAGLPLLDTVADAVGGATAQLLLGKVKPGGVFATVLGPPANASEFPAVKVAPVFATADAKILLDLAAAVQDGRLAIPITRRMPLASAAEAQATPASGKTVLVVRG